MDPIRPPSNPQQVPPVPFYPSPANAHLLSLYSRILHTDILEFEGKRGVP